MPAQVQRLGTVLGKNQHKQKGRTMDNLFDAAGHVLPVHPPGYVGATGYARTRDGRVLCYSCADAAQVAELADPSTIDASVYAASDGRALTSWTGGELARVIEHGYSSRAGFDGMHYWTALTPDGRRWHGRNGGPGTSLHVRAYKRT